MNIKVMILIIGVIREEKIYKKWSKTVFWRGNARFFSVAGVPAAFPFAYLIIVIILMNHLKAVHAERDGSTRPTN